MLKPKSVDSAPGAGPSSKLAHGLSSAGPAIHCIYIICLTSVQQDYFSPMSSPCPMKTDFSRALTKRYHTIMERQWSSTCSAHMVTRIAVTACLHTCSTLRCQVSQCASKGICCCCCRPRRTCAGTTVVTMPSIKLGIMRQATLSMVLIAMRLTMLLKSVQVCSCARGMAPMPSYGKANRD